LISKLLLRLKYRATANIYARIESHSTNICSRRRCVSLYGSITKTFTATLLEQMVERVGFFYRVGDAQLAFLTHNTREVTGLVLHQNGLDQEAEKIK
jgi:hypothetical protein